MVVVVVAVVMVVVVVVVVLLWISDHRLINDWAWGAIEE